MSTSTAKLLRGQPPSPPQSPNGSSGSDSKLNSVMPLNPTYGNPEGLGLAGMNGHPAIKMGYDCDPQQLAYTSAPYLVPNSDSSRLLPIHHPIHYSNLNVNTPPPAADESAVSSNMESTPPIWPAPKPKARVSRQPKTYRRAKKMKERSKIKVVIPLSESTQHLTHIPIRDMEKFVCRPIDVRKQEVTKRQGRVARPMNSFMLYRSAYAERTKELSSQNNHQVVSETAGDSWKLESKEIREKYESLANIEKSNHLKAHPGYKFSPSKKDKQPDEVRSEPDPDQELSRTSSPSFIQGDGRGVSCGVESNSWGNRDFTPFDQDHGLPSASYLSSSWQTGHPDRPFSDMIPPSEPTAHYLQSSPIPPGILSMQDLQFSSSAALAGLPGGTHRELLQPQTSMPPPASYTDGQLDPQLLKRDSPSQAHVFHNEPYNPMWPVGPTSNCYVPATTSMPSNAVAYSISGYHRPGMQTLLEPGQDTTDLEGPGGEFDHWIDPHQTGY